MLFKGAEDRRRHEYEEAEKVLQAADPGFVEGILADRQAEEKAREKARADRAKLIAKVDKDLPKRAAELKAAYQRFREERLDAAAEKLARDQLRREAGLVPAHASQLPSSLSDEYISRTLKAGR